jgi:hypothetical protein
MSTKAVGQPGKPVELGDSLEAALKAYVEGRNPNRATVPTGTAPGPYYEGRAARGAGKLLSQCPYEAGYNAEAWRRGWYEGA